MTAPPELPRVSDYAAWWAARTPSAEALVLANPDGSAQRWTFADLAADVDRLARALLAAGIGKGDRVATLQTPHPDYFIAFLATASVGAIWVGLNPRYRLPELQHVLQDAEPAILLARTRIDGRDYRGDLRALTVDHPALRVVTFEGDPPADNATSMADFLRAGADVSDQRLGESRATCGSRDACLIVYTSGTTGRPKGALLAHGGMIAFSVNQNAIWPVSPMRLINYFPINHIGCVIDVSVPALVAGGALIFIEQFDPHQTMALIGHERITVWGSVPSVFAMQLALPTFAQYDLSSLQLIVWGGAAMPQDLAAALVAIHPRLATNYGMTETSSAITALEPTADLELLTGSVGSAFPGVEVRLVNAQGGVPEFGEPGEVLARSRLNFLGYWRRPDATAEAFDAHGFFRTGDLASLRPDGRYRIVGRVKEMFKSGGYNVYPREVEAVLEAHPAVALVAVVAAPDPVWQEIGVAYVTPMAEVPPGELEAWCRERLANYKVPKRFVIEPDMPHLPIGKIDKMALKRRAAQPDPA